MFGINLELFKNRNWIKDLDEIKKLYDLKSDTSLGRYLGVTQQAIDQIRHNGKQPGPIMKIQIIDRLKFAEYRDLLLAIAPEKQANAIRKYWNTVTKKSYKVLEIENSIDKTDE